MTKQAKTNVLFIRCSPQLVAALDKWSDQQSTVSTVTRSDAVRHLLGQALGLGASK